MGARENKCQISHELRKHTQVKSLRKISRCEF